MAKKVLVVELITDLLDKDGNVIGKLVSDKAGNELKVKKGQGGKLAEKWDELEAGKAYEFEMGVYKGYPFVQDFHKVENVFKQEAQREAVDTQIIAKNKSVALSYAKDLVVAEKLDLENILSWSEAFYRYTVGELTVEDVRIISVLGVKNEITKVDKDKQVDNKPEEEQVPGQNSGEATDREKQVARIGELGEGLGWSSSKKVGHMKLLFQKGSINKLTKEELDTLESDLIARKDSIPFQET